MKFQKSKLLLVVCLMFALMSIMLTGCGSSDSSSVGSDSSAAAPAGGTKTYEDTKNGIKFNYPESWGELEKAGDGAMAGYVSKVTDQKDYFAFNIVVQDVPTKIDWSTYGKTLEQQLKAQDSLKDFKVLSNKTYKVAGCEGSKIEYTGDSSGIKMKSSMLALGNDKKMFLITVAGSETAFDKNASSIENLVKSFTIK